MVIHPKYSVSKLVETIKTTTSKALRPKFTFLNKIYWDNKEIWAKGYFVSSGNERRSNQKIRRITRKKRNSTSKA